MGTNCFSKEVQELVEISNELSDIGSAIGLLSWDQEVMMPPKGAAGRAQQLATMSGIYHEKLTDRKIGKLIKDIKMLSDLNVYDLALVREIGREYDKATKIPQKLVKEVSEATSRAFDAWQKAKPEDDFKIFAPFLEKLLELKVQAAKLVKLDGQSVYDAMLDDYDEGLKETEIEAAFSITKPKLVELAAKLARTTSGRDEKLKSMSFEKDQLSEFVKGIVTKMGLDMQAGRIDTAPHPFETTFGISDVRITGWNETKSFQEAVLVLMHETGHALYEQGVNHELERTHLAGGQGLVLHESQSRLWENHVGRSVAFWQYYFPELQKLFPEMAKVTLIELVQALNVVRPSLIRVEADEVTYGLHIMLRFEVEKELVAGKIKVADLPTIWNEKMKDMLGVVPESDKLGVLQDIHWAHGNFGYFPTYLLGTMTAAQIWRAANDQIPSINDQLNLDSMKQLREWLRENIHKHGRVYLAKDLIKKVTGEDLNPKYFLEYLEKKFENIL